MPVLSLVNVHHAYGSRPILAGATLSVENTEKIGLVGRNGSGKTTLMKIITGQIAPDAGTVSLQRGARVGYLSQDPEFDSNDTVRDAAERAFAELHDLHVQMHEVYERMAGAEGAGAAGGAEGVGGAGGAGGAEGEELDRLLKRQARLEAQIEAAGGYAIDHKIDAMLHGLGFTDDQFALKVGALSGGQKGRLGLARLLLEEPDVLLLDEPTNHLDIAGRQWLERFLAEEYHGAVIVVSHDRWLLDRVVQRIIEVERGAIREYPGNYHAYVDLRRERQLTEARVHDKQMDRIRQEQSFIDRYRAGQRARQAKGREARLERFKRDEVGERPAELAVMNLRLPPAPPTGDQVIVAEGLSKAYGEKILFRDFDMAVVRGERVGVIGPNGAGKTTLVRCLLGEEPVDAGTVRLGSRLNIGYYRQSHEHVDMSLSVWQYLQSVIVGLDGSARASEQQARDLAGAFLFTGSEQDKPLGSLSGGERSRAVLAGLVAGAHNVLVLDEPSNHLDIPSAERLEQALSGEGGFEGTLLLITHDRQLLQDTCDRLVILDGEGGAREFAGRYSDWEQRQRREREEASAAAEAAAGRRLARERRTAAPHAANVKAAAGGPGPHARLKMEELEARLERAQQRISEIDRQMGDPAVYAHGVKIKALQAERAEAERELRELEEEWLRRADG